MEVAIISDIHGNLDALTVVLDDIKKRGIEDVYCLGDTIGYGPNPLECLDLVMEKCRWMLMGNHDFAALFEPTAFNSSAESAAYWTRRQFELEPDEAKRRRRWQFLGNLDFRQTLGAGMCYHASPRRPINEYIFPDDIFIMPAKIRQIFDRVKTRCFVGHTHHPGVFTDEPEFYPPPELDYVYRFNDEKCIINPGSVGQPRDHDPRSSYAIVSDTQVEFIRLEYDVQAVIKKIKKIDQLNNFLGTRLLDGR